MEGKLKIGQKVSRKVAARWTPALVEDGFTPVSTFFLDGYTRLPHPLSSSEAMFVLYLIRFKWDNRKPFPSFETMAERMDVSYNAVRSYARSLQRKGYLQRTRIRNRVEFDLRPLFDALEKLRVEASAG